MPTTDVDEFLAHYGVPGMKWGQRRAHAANMRSLDKAEKRKDREKQAKDVTAARAKLKSGELKARTKEAKAQYKADREVIGKVAARKVLQKTYDKNIKVIEKANEYKNGKEVALSVAAAVAGVALVGILNSRNV